MDQHYADSSPFVELFGNPGAVKILDVFLRKHYEEMTVTDVIELAGVSRSTFHRNLSALQELGVVEAAGKDGNATKYRLNKENELAGTLARMHADVLSHSEQILSGGQSSDAELIARAAMQRPKAEHDSDNHARARAESVVVSEIKESMSS